MKFKVRLILAFFSMTLIPMVLILLAVAGLTNYQTETLSHGDHGRPEGIAQKVEILSGGSMRVFNHLTRKVQKEIHKNINEHPEYFADANYLDEINKRLQLHGIFLIIRKNEVLTYMGSDAGSDNTDLYESLPQMSLAWNDGGIYLDGKEEYIIKQFDFNGGTDTVFLVWPVIDFVPEVKNLVIKILITGIGFLIFSGVLFIIWVYHSVLIPMRKLQKATQQIRDGNLDYVLDVDRESEIGRLCQDFEAMRLRLKESGEEKIRHDRESKELISNIAHDLKTPITAIKGYAEGILDGVASSPEKHEKYIRTIFNKAGNMDKLIDELTFYSKIDTNKIPYTFSKINVFQFFKECIEGIGLDMEAKGLEFGYFNSADEAIMVVADAEQLKRVLNNIIGNSIKYLDKKRGIIHLRVKDAGEFIKVEIEDNGRGIATADIPYIFDRFYRSDVSRNSATGGSGIGLSIVKKIIEDHGGKIWATSTEGVGTQIHFLLRKYQEVMEDEQDFDY